MATEIKVPALGESVTEATVGQWFKKPGEAVKVDEPLVELETDKVTVEVPSPVAGVLSDIMVQQGSTVGIGSVLGSICRPFRQRRHAACSGRAQDDGGEGSVRR
jgi:2-oxoglutarate dehydrogenase E2 component (dihydrolipoamide succinyltransferase)